MGRPDVHTTDCADHGPELWTVSDRPYRKGMLFNPTAALKRVLAARNS